MISDELPDIFDMSEHKLRLFNAKLERELVFRRRFDHDHRVAFILGLGYFGHGGSFNKQDGSGVDYAKNKSRVSFSWVFAPLAERLILSTDRQFTSP
jgi:hypothetical protein